MEDTNYSVLFYTVEDHRMVNDEHREYSRKQDAFRAFNTFVSRARRLYPSGNTPLAACIIDFNGKVLRRYENNLVTQ